jgi:hypothetical protein
MSLFFLHQRRGSSIIRDEEGAEFASFAEAREEAIVAARELLSEMVLTGRLDLTATFIVEGPDGQHAELRFAEAVQLIQ